MIFRMTRRGALLLPLILAACGDEEPVTPTHRDFPPLRYGYLPPIPLNVQRVEMTQSTAAGTGDGEVINSSPVSAAETLYAMARDRLKPVAASGTATFSILNASIVQRRDTMNGVLAVRLDVRSGDGSSSGYAEARVTATHSGSVPDSRAAVYDMLKTMMENMNVEFEYQLRNKLRAWIVEPIAAPSSPAPPPSSPALPPDSAPPPELGPEPPTN
jgi:hypothetical protein